MIVRTATASPIELVVKGRPFGATTAAQAAVDQQGVGGDHHGTASARSAIQSFAVPEQECARTS